MELLKLVTLTMIDDSQNFREQRKYTCPAMVILEWNHKQVNNCTVPIF
ncbi:hypothetical protein [Chryseobacterium salivictor]|nr:hypothetical protein [Chryseobacterium salivictor]